MNIYNIINWLKYPYDNYNNRDKIVETLYLKLKKKINSLGLEIKDDKKFSLSFLYFIYSNSILENYNLLEKKKNNRLNENKDKFEEIFSIDLLDIYRKFEIYNKKNAFDLLIYPNKENYNQFIELIYQNVYFTFDNSFDDSEQSEEDILYDEDFYD